MAILKDLIARIEDSALRDLIAKETEKLTKQKKFGLVFEEHLPECTPLYEVPIKKGSTVAKKLGAVSDIHILSFLSKMAWPSVPEKRRKRLRTSL